MNVNVCIQLSKTPENVNCYCLLNVLCNIKDTLLYPYNIVIAILLPFKNWLRKILLSGSLLYHIHSILLLMTSSTMVSSFLPQDIS